jgi:hypothetical protein
VEGPVAGPPGPRYTPGYVPAAPRGRNGSRPRTRRIERKGAVDDVRFQTTPPAAPVGWTGDRARAANVSTPPPTPVPLVFEFSVNLTVMRGASR